MSVILTYLQGRAQAVHIFTHFWAHRAPRQPAQGGLAGRARLSPASGDARALRVRAGLKVGVRGDCQRPGMPKSANGIKVTPSPGFTSATCSGISISPSAARSPAIKPDP